MYKMWEICMIKPMIERLRAAIKDAEACSPKHGVIISQTDAKRLLYRLLKEENHDRKKYIPFSV